MGVGLVQRRGSGPGAWVWSRGVGLVQGRGSGPGAWVWSRGVGLVQGRWSGPGAWVWSRGVGLVQGRGSGPGVCPGFSLWKDDFHGESRLQLPVHKRFVHCVTRGRFLG